MRLPPPPLVGFYVHHHGLGHLTRARAILPHLDSRAAVLSSADLSRLVDGRGAQRAAGFLDALARRTVGRTADGRGLSLAGRASRDGGP